MNMVRSLSFIARLKAEQVGHDIINAGELLGGE